MYKCGTLTTTQINPIRLNGELYKRINDFLQDYVVQMEKKGEHLMGEDLLKFYTNTWEDFKFSCRVLNGITAYLSRHYVRRCHDGGDTNVHEVHQLALVIWRDNLLRSFSQKVCGKFTQIFYES